MHNVSLPYRRNLATGKAFLRVALPLCVAVLLLFSDDAAAQSAARVYSVEGKVEGRRGSTANWQDLTANTELQSGDAVRTGDGSKIALVGLDGLMVRLGANAFMELKPSPNGATAPDLNLARGDAYILSRDPHKVTAVTTSFVSGSIRGTEFAVSAGVGKSEFTVLDGEVELHNSFGAALLSRGEGAEVLPGRAPEKRIVVRPYDAVQWSLRYPALVSVAGFVDYFTLTDPGSVASFEVLRRRDLVAAEHLFTGAAPADQLGRLLRVYLHGGVHEALAKLPVYRSDEQIALTILRSALNLEVGDVAGAERLQKQSAARLTAMGRSPGVGILRALLTAQRAVVSVALNKATDAQAQVAEALALSKELPEALFSSSLLAQSRGDIRRAREILDRLLVLEPHNPAFLARAAELAFGSGELRRAEELIAEALTIDPQSSDAQSLSGFIQLAHGNIPLGVETFQHAVERGEANAAAHLGLGIGLIATGKLEEGRVEIQKAVHLEPLTALYRSYLGKAFFEGEHEEKAAEEFSHAIELDPLDPTPHLYAAFNFLARYQPVLALNEIESSIEKNDNRAVYRSRLLLDQDGATRSVGLGRVFAALDFNRPAKIEALRSLSEDPSNYSAHFLLKDSLFGLGTDSAAITEDVIGTLLAPASFSALRATTSSAATLNDYTTLFERSQARTSADVIAQSKERIVDSSLAHVWGDESSSYLLRVGQTYSDGYRTRDYLRSTTARALGQWEITSDQKVLAEVLGTSRDQGDRDVGVDPRASDPTLDVTFRDVTGRLGYRYSLGSSSQVLAQVLGLSTRVRASQAKVPNPFDVTITENGQEIFSGEDSADFDQRTRTRVRGGRADLQHIYASEWFSLVSGGSIVRFRERQLDARVAGTDELEIFDEVDLNSSAHLSTHAYRGYSYLTGKPWSWFHVVGGLSYDNLHFAPRQSEPFLSPAQGSSLWSPKAGFMLYPGHGITVRGAYVEGLGVASTRELEGLEPSQVAGLQRIFDDPVGTRSRMRGVGVDWKAPRSTYLGVELVERNLVSPDIQGRDQITADTDGTIGSSVRGSYAAGFRKEQSVTAYLNQVLSGTLVGGVEYDWADSDDNVASSGVRTHKIRIGANYFHSSGFFAFGSTTWRRQDRSGFDTQDGTDDFWVTSAGVGVQLPHRRGSVQLAARNIFDRSYRYLPTASDGTLYPGVDVSLGINLNF